MTRWRVYIPALTIEVILLCACFAIIELKSSRLQAHIFSSVSKEIGFHLKRGAAENIRFPDEGPYDLRLGYNRIPLMSRSLKHNGFRLESQARSSPRLRQLVDFGLFPIYREKTAGGLTVLDQEDRLLYQAIRPERTFPSFESIPPIVVDSLLFIENREILDTEYPLKNPAVEWDRLGKAVLEKAVQEIYPEHSAPGGSTLATQLEKYRHSSEGRTRHASDKLQQMLSASFRAYLDGPQTFLRRKGIVRDYINSIPLAALPGYGEVNGLGDGLWAWYGSDMDEVMPLLADIEHNLENEKLPLYYKQVLSLFIAHRRPSSFLLTDVAILNALTDEYLQLLANSRVIPTALCEAAQNIELHLRSTAPPPPTVSFLDRKAANAIRTQLLTSLGVHKLYDLDLIDATVHTTIDREVQQAVTETLRALKEKSEAAKLGLTGERTLDRGDPAKVIYSVTLYEHRAGRNLLRIQTDNYDKPFSINEGTKLDLGSTAKLRVSTNYLEIVSRNYDKHRNKTKQELLAERKLAADPISEWIFDYLIANPKTELAPMLKAAMSRTYSANPGEAFFTGGGVHHFENFKKEDNGKVVTISEAIRHSINLPFIRLMRDIVRYYMAQIPGSPTRTGRESDDEARQKYLAMFADKEGSYFLEQFYKKYRSLAKDELVSMLIQDINPTPVRLAVIYRYTFPDKSIEDFQSFLESWLPQSTISSDTVLALYNNYAPGKFSLQDTGYLARVHPLEIWLVRYLYWHPERSISAALAASAQERQEVYEWLFKSHSRHAQDVRIRTLVETEAFVQIHRDWKRLGYPFDSLVPSYATAIGSSGDRPSALADLVGIILNDGVKYPNVRVSAVGLAPGTPFETFFRHRRSKGKRILRSEVAAQLREALVDVVANGTARRVDKAFLDLDGKPLVIGGKTGTGDHRYETFGRGGQLISSRVVNRTATFAFFIGSRFFGVVTAHVQGEEAAKYDFTSALAASLLKALAPAISPLIQGVRKSSDPLLSQSQDLALKYMECLTSESLLPLLNSCSKAYVRSRKQPAGKPN